MTKVFVLSFPKALKKKRLEALLDSERIDYQIKEMKSEKLSDTEEQALRLAEHGRPVLKRAIQKLKNNSEGLKFWQPPTVFL